jgi:hypothetical protein
MLSLKKKNYGKFLMFKFPWMNHRKGIGFANPEYLNEVE